MIKELQNEEKSGRDGEFSSSGDEDDPSRPKLARELYEGRRMKQKKCYFIL